MHSLEPQNDRYDDESFCFWVILTSVSYSGTNHTCIVHLSNVTVPEKLRIAPSIWGSKDLVSNTATASGRNLISTSWWNVCWSRSKFLHVELIVQCQREASVCILEGYCSTKKGDGGGTCSCNWFVSKQEEHAAFVSANVARTNNTLSDVQTCRATECRVCRQNTKQNASGIQFASGFTGLICSTLHSWCCGLHWERRGRGGDRWKWADPKTWPSNV